MFIIFYLYFIEIKIFGLYSNLLTCYLIGPVFGFFIY